MPIFTYEAKTIRGELLKGKMEGADKEDIIDGLRQRNYFPVTVREYNAAENIEFSQFKRISIKDIAIFCREFSFTISAGLSILRALDIIKNQTDNKKFRKILGEVYKKVEKGKALSEAFGEYEEMPNMLVSMIAAGEASGTLDNIMLRMADYYDKEYKQQQKVKQAMTYPIVVSIFAIFIVNILVIKVLPTFAGSIKSAGMSLPLPTRIVLSISNFIRTKGIYLLLVIVVFFFAVKHYLKNNKEKSKAFDKYKLTMPIFGKINKKVVTAKFARTFGTLMASGVSLLESIDICADVVGNKVIKEVILSSKDDLKRGIGLGDTLEARNAFPPMLIQMIKIGEESGSLDSILDKTAEFYDGEVENATQQMTTLIEPAIIIILAIIVGFIVFSIILPIFESYDAVGMLKFNFNINI